MQPIKLIKHALDSTISLINNGEDPSSALEKVARELDLNTNYIQRTGEALNVAHYDHFKKASDRSTDFAVADIPGVTSRIFGEEEKSLAQKRAEWFPKIAEEIDYNKILTNPKLKKATQQIKSTKADFDTFSISFKGQFEKAANYIRDLEQELDLIKTEKVANDAYLEASFFNLVNQFKKTAEARTPFHEFESQAFATYGERAVPYIELIYKSASSKEERGSHDDKYISFTPCRELELFSSMLKSADQKPKLTENVKEASEFVDDQKTTFRQIGYRLNPVAQAFDKAACDKLDRDLDKLAEDLEKQAVGEIGRGLFQEMFNQFRDTTSGGGEKKPVFQNSQVDNRERMAMLQELIMTDPILKKIDPRKVIAAYQQILRLAPQISKERDVMRAKLREMTATGDGSIHPVDANQLVDVNTNFMKQHMLSQSTDAKSDDKKDKY